MRLFVAVELPDEVRQVLKAGLAVLKRDLPPSRWVRADAMHLTLKFLGEQPLDLPERLDRAAADAVAACAPVEVRLGGGGFFPGPHRPRVAWVGGDAPGLGALAAAVDRAAAACGVPAEERPFSLHLTLARLDRPWGVHAVEDFLVRVGKLHFPPFSAREAVLFESRLKPSGAEHTALRRWAVGAPGRPSDGAGGPDGA